MKMKEEDIQLFIKCCRVNLPLAVASLSDEYYYSNIPICVIDAVFSIAAHYSSTTRVVNRFCNFYSLQKLDKTRLTNTKEQFSVKDFLENFQKYGVSKMVSDVYQNRQRTSTKNGILKAEATQIFCQVLERFGVDKFPDLLKIIGQTSFENAIMQIPGQRSGISLRYFYMLVGEDSYIKPDRMVTRFISFATGKNMDINESQSLITESVRLLKIEYPQLTPRLLDNLIWNFQRTR